MCNYVQTRFVLVRDYVHPTPGDNFSSKRRLVERQTKLQHLQTMTQALLSVSKATSFKHYTGHALQVQLVQRGFIRFHSPHNRKLSVQ